MNFRQSELSKTLICLGKLSPSHRALLAIQFCPRNTLHLARNIRLVTLFCFTLIYRRMTRATHLAPSLAGPEILAAARSTCCQGGCTTVMGRYRGSLGLHRGLYPVLSRPQALVAAISS